MITISQDKLKIIKKLKNSSDIYKVLEEEIKEAILNKTKMPLIKIAIEEAIGKELSLQSLKNFVAQNKKRWIEENKKGEKMENIYDNMEEIDKITQNDKEDDMKKRFILLANDKGGVGKTTLATLIDLPKSLILNLDLSREIADIYPYKKIVDFGKVKEEENIELEDFLELLSQSKEFKNIIIDTKGGITEDLLKVLPYIDTVIIPIKVGTTSEKPSYEFIMELKTYIDELNKKKVNWAIVYNEISPKFLQKSGIGKFELIDDLKENAKLLKKEVLGKRLKAVTYFKRSEAIATREMKKKDIEELLKENFGAYLVIKNEIKRLNKDLEPAFKD
ncbi:hypothetical protein [Caminibacter sp.]